MLSAEQPWVTAALVSSLSGSADAGACLASRVWDAAPQGGMRLFSGSESTVCLCKTPSEDRRFPSPVPSSCTACGVVIQAVFPGARCGSVCGVTSSAPPGACRSCTSPVLHLPAAASRAGLDSPGACGCQPRGSHVEERAGQLFSAWGSLPASLHPSLPKPLHESSEAGAVS